MKQREIRRIDGARIALLATDGFEQSELLVPRRELRDAGAEVDVVSLERGTIRGWSDGNWSDEVDVDVLLGETSAADYDALVLPGGVMNPDRLRVESDAKTLVREFVAARKPVAAICHGPWLLIDAEVVKGRNVTSWPSLRRDLENAGAIWTDEEVVLDEGLITSREPGDLPAFCRAIVESLQAAEPGRVG